MFTLAEPCATVVALVGVFALFPMLPAATAAAVFGAVDLAVFLTAAASRRFWRDFRRISSALATAEGFGSSDSRSLGLLPAGREILGGFFSGASSESLSPRASPRASAA